MILLDTTVLVYAVGAQHRLRAPCRAVIEAVGAARLHATTTVEVVQEFAHVRARRRSRDDAARLARSFATLLAPLATVDEVDLDHGLTLFASTPSVGAFDSVLAAVARQHEVVTALVSADRAFADVPGLVHHDPADPDFARSLGLS